MNIEHVYQNVPVDKSILYTQNRNRKKRTCIWTVIDNLDKTVNWHNSVFPLMYL